MKFGFQFGPMKTFLGLNGFFVLCFLIWTCAGDWSAVQVQCTQFWFCARIKPAIFHISYINSEEVFLGDGCPITYVLLNVYYESHHHPLECGIVNKTLQEILFKTKIMYISRNSPVLKCLCHVLSAISILF